MGARKYFRHFFGFENFGPVIFLGRLKICPNEHPYLKFYRVPPPWDPGEWFLIYGRGKGKVL